MLKFETRMSIEEKKGDAHRREPATGYPRRSTPPPALPIAKFREAWLCQLVVRSFPFPMQVVGGLTMMQRKNIVKQATIRNVEFRPVPSTLRLMIVPKKPIQEPRL